MRLQLIVLYVEGATTAIFTPGATVHWAADGDRSLRDCRRKRRGTRVPSPYVREISSGYRSVDAYIAAVLMLLDILL
jgi:hypothetical protein